MHILPREEQINSWIEQFVPEKDLFFMEKNDLKAFDVYLNDVLIMPREEFFNHSSYNQIQFINSYMYWTISKKVSYVIVASPTWITRLPKQKMKEMLRIQIRLGAGLTFPLSIFPSRESIPETYIMDSEDESSDFLSNINAMQEENFVVIRNELWTDIPLEIKVNVLKTYGQLLDEWVSEPTPNVTPEHLVKYAHQFTTNPGSNCLAATLYAITEEEWILHEWIHPETFLHGLYRAQYMLTSDNQIKSGDVVTWVNEENVVQHATYHIKDGLCFNKNGQTFFEPWKIVHIDQIKSIWSKQKINIYRK